MTGHDPRGGGLDPYAPPGAHSQAPLPGTPVGTGSTNWTVGDAISFPFRALFSDPGRILFPMVLPAVVTFGVNIVTSFGLQGGMDQFDFSPEGLARQQHLSGGVIIGMLVSYVIQFFVQTWMYMNLFRFGIEVARGRVPEIGSKKSELE